MNTATKYATELNLPRPGDRPESAVVIFDGQCQFCRAQVQRLANWDSRAHLAFVSLHDPWVDEHYPDLTHEQLMDEMYVIPCTGERYHGAGAFRYLTRKIPRLWVLAPLLHIPFSLPLWQWGYRWVAKQRYRWGKIADCENDACAVHFGKR